MTIWFQNKRQSERRIVLRNTTNSVCLPATDKPTACAPTRQSSLPSISSSTTSTDSTANITRPWGKSAATRPSQTRPLLDQIASRTERSEHNPVAPKLNATPWDNMTKSPSKSLSSPEIKCRPLLRRAPTLEWACEVARQRAKRNSRESEDEEWDMGVEKQVKKRRRCDDVASKATIMANAERPVLQRSRTMHDLRSPFRSTHPNPRPISTKPVVRSSSQPIDLVKPPSPRLEIPECTDIIMNSPTPVSAPVSPSIATTTPATTNDDSAQTMGHTPTVVTPKSKLITPRQTTPAQASDDADAEVMQAAWALCGLGGKSGMRRPIAC